MINIKTEDGKPFMIINDKNEITFVKNIAIEVKDENSGETNG